MTDTKPVYQAVILAGGRGTRLGSITDTIPKPMVEVNGTPFLELLIRYLRKQGIGKVLLLTGYKSECIEQWFSGEGFSGIQIEYSVEKEPLGTGGALKNAEHLIDDEFFLINGDTMMWQDHIELADKASSGDFAGVVTVFNNKKGIMKDNISVNENSVVRAYSKENRDDLSGVEGGFSFFRKDILAMIPEKKNCSLEFEVFPELIVRGKLGGVITDRMFYDIGTPEGLKKAAEVLG